MRTATRWTTLVKLPVALSGGSSENCAPEAGETDDDHALDHLAVERVDGDIHFLSRLDVGELGFLEVGVDVGGVERHERHQPGSRLHQVSDFSRLVADGSVEGRERRG